jgi:hypothetical protein
VNIFVNSQGKTAKAAKSSVNAVIEAFQELSKSNSFQQDTERLREAVKRETVLQSKIEDITNRILDSAMEYGGPETLAAEAKAWLDMLAEASMTVRRLSRQLEAMGMDPEGAAETEEAKQERPPVTNEQIAMENPEMANLLLERDKLVADIEYLKSDTGLGDQNARVVRARRHLEAVEKGISRIRAAHLKALPPQFTVGGEVNRLKALLRMQMETMQLCRAEAQQLGRIRARIERESSDKNTLVARLERERRLIEELNFQLRDKGRISVVSWGETGTEPSRDHRARFALIGGATGLGAVLLLGLCGVLLSRLRRWMNA